MVFSSHHGWITGEVAASKLVWEDGVSSAR
jgi:hypothetical protein